MPQVIDTLYMATRGDGKYFPATTAKEAMRTAQDINGKAYRYADEGNGFRWVRVHGVRVANA